VLEKEREKRERRGGGRNLATHIPIAVAKHEVVTVGEDRVREGVAEWKSGARLQAPVPYEAFR
jgi:hypothetical protein